MVVFKSYCSKDIDSYLLQTVITAHETSENNTEHVHLYSVYTKIWYIYIALYIVHTLS